MDLQAETGSGLISSLAGLVVFLFFLLFAAQVLVHLAATSFVTAAAFDAARLASAAEGMSATAAEQHGRSLLGSFSAQVTTFDVAVGDTAVTVEVQATTPALVGAALRATLRAGTIHRRVTVRREQLQCASC